MSLLRLIDFVYSLVNVYATEQPQRSLPSLPLMLTASKNTTASLAVEGLCRLVQSRIKRAGSKGIRAYAISQDVFGIDGDHKNLLTWAALKRLEERGDIYRVYWINETKAQQEHPGYDNYLDYLMATGQEDLWDEFYQSLPKNNWCQFFHYGALKMIEVAVAYLIVTGLLKFLLGPKDQTSTN